MERAIEVLWSARELGQNLGIANLVILVTLTLPIIWQGKFRKHVYPQKGLFKQWERQAARWHVKE